MTSQSRRRALSLLLGALTATSGISPALAGDVTVADSSSIAAPSTAQVGTISFLEAAYLIDGDADVEAEVVPIAPGAPEAIEEAPELVPSGAGEPEIMAAPVGEAEETAAEGEDAPEDSLQSQFAAMQERINDLEKSLDEVSELADDPTIVRSGTSRSTMKVSGRVHFDGWGFDTDDDPDLVDFNDGEEINNNLQFRRLRFGVKGKIRDNMLYKIEMELAGGNKSEFRDAYLGWTGLPIFQEVLLGNQKRPYGLDHLNSSRYNVFLERPFVIEGFNQDARRLGLQSYGISEDLAWNWRYGVFNQRNIQSLGKYVDDHLQLQIAGRLANTIWYDDISGGRGYAHWAISGTHADSTTEATPNEAQFITRPEARPENKWLDTGEIDGADSYELLGLEGVVNVGAFQVVGEYQSVWVDREIGFANTQFDGGYVYLSYFLTGEHIPWERKSGTLGRVIPFQNFWLVDRCDGCRDAGWGAWQIAARYSRADFSDEDILGGEGESFTFGVNWHWNPNARMQFNYITGGIENRDAGSGVASGNYNIYGARFMVDF